MKKQQLVLLTLALLMASILIMSTACSDKSVPSSIGSDSANAKIQTEANARELVQSWLDDHPFDETVTIRDSLTNEDDNGFNFTLYGDEEFARVRVVKSSGMLLRYNPSTDQYTAINDWYATLSNNAKVDSNNGNVTDAASTTPDAPNSGQNETGQKYLTEAEASALVEAWLNKHPFPFDVFVEGGSENTIDGEEYYLYDLYMDNPDGDIIHRMTTIYVHKKTGDLFYYEVVYDTIEPSLDDWYNEYYGSSLDTGTTANGAGSNEGNESSNAKQSGAMVSSKDLIGS